MKAIASLVALTFFTILFVLKTSAALPATAATLFGENGTPTGFMSRDQYIAFTVALIIFTPAVVVLGGYLVKWLPASVLNLPNKDYWLAPERRDASINWIVSRTVVYAHLLLLFLAFVHWLVLDANTHTPARLAEGPFITGLVMFLVVTLIWIISFYTRFRRRQ